MDSQIGTGSIPSFSPTKVVITVPWETIATVSSSWTFNSILSEGLRQAFESGHQIQRQSATLRAIRPKVSFLSFYVSCTPSCGRPGRRRPTVTFDPNPSLRQSSFAQRFDVALGGFRRRRNELPHFREREIGHQVQQTLDLPMRFVQSIQHGVCRCLLPVWRR